MIAALGGIGIVGIVVLVTVVLVISYFIRRYTLWPDAFQGRWEAG
jgi:hypothetical protein